MIHKISSQGSPTMRKPATNITKAVLKMEPTREKKAGMTTKVPGWTALGWGQLVTDRSTEQGMLEDGCQ